MSEFSETSSSLFSPDAPSAQGELFSPETQHMMEAAEALARAYRQEDEP